ncbi:MAG: hypothetical protein GWO24_03275 [Akkermansiaceae bacterium]|nr:hypothetical protein [Akkermansiaceae bacterium]
MAGCSPTARRPKRRPGRHLRARTTGIRIVNRVAFVILITIACVAIAALSVPQVRELRRLKEKLARSKVHENHMRSYRDQKRRELSALRTDPSYLELVARDRLDFYRSGELIYRFRR